MSEPSFRPPARVVIAAKHRKLWRNAIREAGGFGSVEGAMLNQQAGGNGPTPDSAPKRRPRRSRKAA